LNFTGHFKLRNQNDYHRVGDALAPKDIWNELYPEHHAGLANLTIRLQQGTRANPGKTNDQQNISLQASTKFKFGAFLSYNDHHDIRAIDDDMSPAECVAAIIDTGWEASWHDAVRVFDGLLSKALEQ